MIDDKTKRQITTNNEYVIALKRYEAKGKLDCDKAIHTHYLYSQLQEKLNFLPDGSYDKFIPNSFNEFVEIPPACEICGFPVRSLLTKHHVIPRSKGGTETIKLCPICHCAIHKSVDSGEIDYGIVSHLSSVDGAVQKFGMYVRICAEGLTC